MWPELDTGWSVAGTGDFNGDGISDILIRNVDGRASDWLGSADGSFSDNIANALNAVTADWHVVGTGDFNGDGRADILWRNDDGTIADWLGTASGGFSGNGVNSRTAVSNDWQVAGLADFNGDGRTDILWVNNTSMADWLATATSTGGFVGNGANSSNAIPASCQVAGVGDFNGDDRADILWRNVNGLVHDWLGTAVGGFIDNSANAPTNIGASYHVAGIGDFNGDGRADILWRDSDGTITDWLGQANGGFVSNSAIARQAVDTSLQIVGVGDFNGDGRDDALFRNDSGDLGIWTAAADGTFVSPAEKAWQDTLTQIGAFFDEINSQIDEYERSTSGGGDQNSYYDDGDYWNRIFEAEADPWSYPDRSGVSLQTFMEEAGALFNTLSPDTFSLTVPFDGSFGSINVFDSLSNTYIFNVDGNLVAGTMHEGTAPAPDPTLPDVLVLGHRSDTNTDVFVTFDDMGMGYTVDFGGSGSSASTGPGEIDFIDASDAERAAADYALALLYKYSPTAHELIDTIVANGTKLNLITASLGGLGGQDIFSIPQNQILWDPFMAVQGRNLDGSLYTESPLMLLAHELVHAGHPSDSAYQGPESETLVMQIANSIAAEMNAATGSNYDTTRDNHDLGSDGHRYNVTSPTSTNYSLVRPQ
jgi:hypothetical protein